MSSDSSYRISFPQIPGDAKRITSAEAEALLLERLDEKKRGLRKAVWQLARFYSSTGRLGIALRCVKQLIASIRSGSWSFRFSIPEIPDREKAAIATEAEALLLKTLDEEKRDLEGTVWQLVQVFSQTGRQDIASAYIKQLMGMTDDLEKVAHCWLALGQTMEQIKDYEGAVDFYKQAFALEPANNQTWYFINNNLGYSLVQLGSYEDAETYCRAAIGIDHKQYNGHKNLGLSLEGQGRYPEAAQSFFDAVKANAVDPRAFNHLERLVQTHPEISYSIPNIDELVENCRKAVRTGIALRDSYMLVRRGETHHNMGRYEEAATDYSRAIELAPENGRIYALRGYAYHRMGRNEEALADFSRAIELDPEDAIAICWQGGTYLVMGRPKEALAAINRAGQLLPDNDWLPYLAALALTKLGCEEEARPYLTKALDLVDKALAAKPVKHDYIRLSYNKALYLLMADRIEESMALYREMLEECGPTHAAIGDLDHFKSLFPDNATARGMRDLLAAHSNNG